MDGASKYVRGDAVAGILILVINIVGGFVIGVAQHDLARRDAADNYTLLAIGDGLVAQIPALMISIAAAMVVSRVGKEHDVGSQIATQVFSSPQALGIVAGDHRRCWASSPACRTSCSCCSAARSACGGVAHARSAQRAAKNAPPHAEVARRSRTPRRAGTTCSRSTRSASKSATG